MKISRILILAVGFAFLPLAAEDMESMDSEDRLTAQEEDLRSIKDSYDSRVNGIMEEMGDKGPEAWFAARAAGNYATWKDIGFELPEVKMFSVKEVPYGFSVKGKGRSQEAATVLVYTRDEDLYYYVTVGKKASFDFKRMVQAVFESDGEFSYREGTPCNSRAVSCLGEYEKGTPGKLKK